MDMVWKMTFICIEYGNMFQNTFMTSMQIGFLSSRPRPIGMRKIVSIAINSNKYLKFWFANVSLRKVKSIILTVTTADANSTRNTVNLSFLKRYRYFSSTFPLDIILSKPEKNL